MPLLAWALTGDSRKTDVVAPLVKPAQLKGYARFSLLGKDYPALIKHDKTSIVDGLLLCPQDKSQRKKLDDFEGETYVVTPVQVTVVGEEDQVVDADIYLWNGARDAVSADHWDLSLVAINAQSNLFRMWITQNSLCYSLSLADNPFQPPRDANLAANRDLVFRHDFYAFFRQ